MTTAPTRAVAGSVPEHASTAARHLLIGAAAGALVGLVLGGVGGRLAMALLRFTSSESVLGIRTDDGFVIGSFGVGNTVTFLLQMAFPGAALGVAYAVVRMALPRRGRVLAWGVFTGLLVSSAVVHADGLDFTLLSPRGLAVGLFVGLPLACGLGAAWLVERWHDRPLTSRRRAGLGVAALVGTFGSLVAVVVWILVLAAGRFVRPDVLLRAGRVVVPVGLVTLAVVFTVVLVGSIAEIARR